MLTQLTNITRLVMCRNLQRSVGCFHTTASSFLKQIVEKKEDNTLVLEGKFFPSSREKYLLKVPAVENKECCTLCTLGLNIKHTDILILSQYLRPDGRMMPRRATHLCSKQQKKISALVSMAHKAGLMSCMGPPESKKDPSRRKEYRKFNSYWYESSIKYNINLTEEQKKLKPLIPVKKNNIPKLKF